MAENRYGEKLREGNKRILELLPASPTLAMSSGAELAKIPDVKNKRIIDLGIGEGDFAKYLFEYAPEIELDGLDISPEMIDSCKANLPGKKINYICKDAAEHLRNFNGFYDVITTGWTIHNFKQKDKVEIFKEIYNRLRNGGKLILMDKIYPDDKSEQEHLFVLQNKRNLNCLPIDLAKEMIAHEYQDFGDDYRMEETPVMDLLKEIGFSNIRIVDRVEREAVLVAEK